MIEFPTGYGIPSAFSTSWICNNSFSKESARRPKTPPSVLCGSARKNEEEKKKVGVNIMRRNRYHQRKRKRKCRPKRRGDNSNVSPDANPSKQISNRQTPRSRSESRCSCTIKMLTERHRVYSPNHSRPSVQQTQKNKREREEKEERDERKGKRRNNVPTISPLAIFASLSRLG